MNPFRERMRLAVVEVEEVDEEAWPASIQDLVVIAGRPSLLKLL